MLAYVNNAPQLDKDSDNCVVSFIDNKCSTNLRLSEIADIILTEEDMNLPSKLQLHKHRPTSYKEHRAKCRFDFPQPPMRSTEILRPFLFDTSPEIVEQARLNLKKSTAEN